ncbi:acyclic terpene utilization AtuA family protein [Algihabitans albus]|uniref:acyclic terpene utilization AtuA family protein n=1 Tax=Algihabitans albus TaxID=2164067 RepID=UPI000E5D0079|nr:acyclic terpene utilization AtuA family protein [Algihabitans albus]
MAQRVLIGCGAGFSGDRTDAAIPVVRELRRREEPAYLFFETLGERTLALAQLRRQDDPHQGHEPLLEEMLEPVLGDCLKAGIPVIGNFGAANPREAARRIARLAVAAGHGDAAIAVVEGDEVTHLVESGDLTPLGLDQGLHDRPLICANAYLGAEPIAEALGQGAEIVVTGRVADPSMAVAPAMHAFGWDALDADRIATATLAGHLLECGSQVTGGYYCDPGFKDVPDLDRVGYPIAELTRDRSVTITKPGDTGGLICEANVKEQLLYEIHEPDAYLTPDVVLDITAVEVWQRAEDRVEVLGARGRTRPERLKVTVSVEGGWLGEGEISYAGPNALARARLALDILAKRLPPHLRLRRDLIGVTSVLGDEEGPQDGALDGRLFEERDVRARIAVEANTWAEAEAATREVTALLCCGPAGGGGVRTSVRRRINTWSATAARAAVERGVRVTLLPARRWQDSARD